MVDIIAFVAAVLFAAATIWYLLALPLRWLWYHWTRRHESRRPGYIDLRPRL